MTGSINSSKDYFFQIPVQTPDFTVPKLVSPWKANTKLMKMIAFSHQRQHFSFSPILCSCKFCLKGMFSDCSKNESGQLKFLIKPLTVENLIPDDGVIQVDEDLDQFKVNYNVKFHAGINFDDSVNSELTLN